MKIRWGWRGIIVRRGDEKVARPSSVCENEGLGGRDEYEKDGKVAREMGTSEDRPCGLLNEVRVDCMSCKD